MQQPPGVCAAIIVAAGSGLRAAGTVPKQYQSLLRSPMLRHTLRAFTEHLALDQVCVVVGAGHEDLFHAAADGLSVLPPVTGGDTRQESVLNGLKVLAESAPEKVLIHDGARPFPGSELISRVVDGLDHHTGVVPALPVVDTLKRSQRHDETGEETVAGTVDRRALWRAQTPQGFRFSNLMAAYETVEGALHMTDDSSIAEAAGLDVVLVAGDEMNLKVTTEQDFHHLEALMAEGEVMETRTGMGYDVHRFDDGDGVHLCGVRIPFDRGLMGHSDADVGLHALCDALFGALGDGDIGAHFPPTDDTWKNAESHIFLDYAAKMVRERGGTIVNVDVTLICQKPAISPHRDTMRNVLAGIMGVDVSRVSIKATTTERLGFTGREEGIAAQAVATVRLPSGGA